MRTGIYFFLSQTVCPILSPYENGNKVRIAALPANDSLTPCIRLNCCDPVKMKRPEVRCSSIADLTYDKSCGTYCISSRIRRGELKDAKNSRGSERARARVSGSSKLT